MINKDINLIEIAKKIRRIILDLSYKNKVGHIGSSFSIVEILTALYFNILKVDPKNSTNYNRDRFILSKGHACTTLYATLHLKGFFDELVLNQFHNDGGVLHGHPCRNLNLGIEFSTGSLGHGLGLGAGVALAAKRLKRDYFTYVLLSDGECNEGEVWETVLFAAQQKLDNLVAIIDYNKIQAFGLVSEVMNLEPLGEKFKAFGWSTVEINGHDFNEIITALSDLPKELNKPLAVIAHTTKGKGVSFMENELAWHYKCPNEQELTQALIELQ